MNAATAGIVVAMCLLTVLLGGHIARGRARLQLPVSATRRGRKAGARSSDLVDVLEHTARDVRSGMALRPALLEALDRRPAVLADVRHQLTRGTSLDTALRSGSQARRGDTAFAVNGLRLAAQTGGAVADTLERVVDVIRERRAWQLERHAQAAQARLSARMLTVLPLAVAGWSLATGPRVRQAYTETPAVAVTTALGIALNLLGWWWMQRLVGPRHVE
jgi:tight adherence protein B